MATASSAGYPESGRSRAARTERPTSAETKPAFKSTEFFVYLAAVVAVLVASAVVGANAAETDRFPAGQAWLYVTLLTIGYMISRGLAKCGSRDITDTTDTVDRTTT
ncbi:hypothetical protein [Streptomyces rimosus]|uniref:hypothetical protein n=1 Tax=Streptomyces rimosus TaxID=1927 RepID=UPI0004CAC604|nr:hypothetical protein [Streptomyces rimosus]